MPEDLHYAFGCDAADSLGVRDDCDEGRDEARRPRLRRAIPAFDPVNDAAARGLCLMSANTAEQAMRAGARPVMCGKRPLKMRNAMDVWYDALITAYVASGTV